MAEFDRRGFLSTSAGGLLLPLLAGAAAAQEVEVLENPYVGVDWDTWQTLDSMSHQHQGQTDASRDLFYDMGYRHLAFSNYYPSAPTPLPEAWLAKHPEALACPNAEHHSFTDSELHANGLGSLAATGDGRSVSSSTFGTSPLVATFKGLNVRGEERPWEAIYRLDVTVSAQPGAEGGGVARLTIEGGRELDPKTYAVIGDGLIRHRERTGRGSVAFRALESTVTATLSFDPAATKVTQFRLMQGSYRPWRDVFAALLEGLQYPDGGGITLNHPTGSIASYLPMLDHDPRVLGIEIWNHLSTGFGSPKGFYDEGPGPHLHFYRLWDEILATGRRCLGFFVKDHWGCGQGRNVLLVPPAAGRSRGERELDALVAYRRGAFFGRLGAANLNEAGALASPFDQTRFRFRRIEVTAPRTVEVEVGGQAERRPNVQLRFVTDQGVEHVADDLAARFTVPGGRRFVRVEAFACPTTQRGEPLTPSRLREMDVWALSQVCDRTLDKSVFGSGGATAGDIPMGTVDMLFSQPFRWRAGR